MPQNTPRDEKWLLRRIADLEQRVKSLETSPRANATSVSTGKFVVFDEDVDMLRIGFLGQVGGVDVRGMEIKRPDGTSAFSTFRGTDTGGFWAWYDRQGNEVVSDDAVAGQGLARPYIGSATFAPIKGITWPSTSSSSFDLLWHGWWFKQHPILQVIVATKSPAGTTGQIQLAANGGSVTQNIPGGDNTLRSLSFAVPGGHLQDMALEISVRVTGGAGSIQAYPYAAFGRQSP